MATGPRLSSLTDNRKGTFSTQVQGVTVTLDLRPVTEDGALGARIAQSLDAGFVAAASSPNGATAAAINSLAVIATKAPGGVAAKFYSNLADFFAGTPKSPSGIMLFSGIAFAP